MIRNAGAPTDISSAALAAVEKLERAHSALDLGPAYAAATLEARRLRPSTPMLDWTGRLVFVAALVTLVLDNEPDWALWAILAVAIVALAQRFRNSFLPRHRMATRVDAALARWTHKVPQMRENPDHLLKDKSREPS